MSGEKINPIIVPKGELHKYRPLTPEEIKKLHTEKADVLKAKTPEGKEVSLDLHRVLEESFQFYKKDVVSFWDALDWSDIKLTEAVRTKILDALSQGFDRALLIPGLETQKAVGLTYLKEELADKPLPGLSDQDQYSESSTSSTGAGLSEISVLPSAQAKRRKPYLLLYSSGPIPEETKKLTYPEAEALFKEKNWDGLTLEEYYLLQRKEADKNKNHSFDALNDDSKQSNITWLLDSRVPGGCVRAGWYPRFQEVYVFWSDTECRIGGLGARPAVVVEL